MIKINEQKKTITGQTLDFNIDGNYHEFNGKITYAQVDVSSNNRQRVSIYLDVDKLGEDNYDAEINWPSFGAEDIEFAQRFSNLLNIAVSVARELEELVKTYNKK